MLVKVALFMMVKVAGYVGDFVFVINRSLSSQIGHQHLKLVTKRFRVKHRSPTSMLPVHGRGHRSQEIVKTFQRSAEAWSKYGHLKIIANMILAISLTNKLDFINDQNLLLALDNSTIVLISHLLFWASLNSQFGFLIYRPIFENFALCS